MYCTGTCRHTSYLRSAGRLLPRPPASAHAMQYNRSIGSGDVLRRRFRVRGATTSVPLLSTLSRRRESALPSGVLSVENFADAVRRQIGEAAITKAAATWQAVRDAATALPVPVELPDGEVLRNKTRSAYVITKRASSYARYNRTLRVPDRIGPRTNDRRAHVDDRGNLAVGHLWRSVQETREAILEVLRHDAGRMTVELAAGPLPPMPTTVSTHVRHGTWIPLAPQRGLRLDHVRVAKRVTQFGWIERHRKTR